MTRKQNLTWLSKPSLIPLQQIKFTQSTKQTNHKHIKGKYINPSAINHTKVDHWINKGYWINKGLLKALKNRTH